jgi:hypothetical protein
LVLESKEELKKRGLDSPDSGDALALTFAEVVMPPEKELPDEDDEFKGLGNWSRPSGWMR